MKILKLDDNTKKNVLEDLLKRSPNQYTSYEESVNAILQEVKRNKDEALFAYSKKFDGAELDKNSLKVSDEELASRRAEMPIKKKENIKGYLKRYAAQVSSADKGAIINK